MVKFLLFLTITVLSSFLIFCSRPSHSHSHTLFGTFSSSSFSHVFFSSPSSFSSYLFLPFLSAHSQRPILQVIKLHPNHSTKTSTHMRMRESPMGLVFFFYIILFYFLGWQFFLFSFSFAVMILTVFGSLFLCESQRTMN